VIRIEHVSKTYRRESQQIPVLKDIQLVLEKGDFVALMGPSGSGKSTLLNLIAGLDRPTSGTITIDNKVISGLSEAKLAPWRARHVGFIFQLYNLIPVLTALENVELPLLLTGLARKERIEHARAALGIVGLGDRMDYYPRQLSGGQEQRVAIARAVVTDPVLLVADEPTGDLDAKSAEEILDLLNRLNSEFGKTIVMVTHDPKAASRAHRVVHLEKGELSLAQMPRQQVESFVAARGQEAQTGGPSTLLEIRFLQRVVAAMADYASARSGAAVPAVRPGTAPAASPAPARPVTPAASSDEGFEGLTALDILELTQRLDTLFESTSFSESPAPVLPGLPTPPARPMPVTSSSASSSRSAAASPLPRPTAAAVASQPAGSPRRSETIELLEKMLGEEKQHARSPAPPGRPPRS
jgi:putative ABC transport system ATP-binding protein